MENHILSATKTCQSKKLRIPRVKIKSIDIPCGVIHYSSLDGDEYDCEYNDDGECTCDECVCNFGDINPITGKRINFILRFIQRKRAERQYKNYGL